MEKEGFSCVYRIVSTATKDCYVGSAKHFGIRRRNHLCQLRKGRHHSPFMQAHVNKFGIEDIYFEVLERHPFDDKIRDREQHYMDLYNPKLNKKKNSRGFGEKASPETIEKLRKSHLGHKPTVEALKKRSDTMKDRLSVLSTEEKNKRLTSARLVQRRKIECVETKIEYESIAEAKRKTGCWDIWKVLNNSKQRTRTGLTFKYSTDELS